MHMKTAIGLALAAVTLSPPAHPIDSRQTASPRPVSNVYLPGA
jgi:hypothetical protein